MPTDRRTLETLAKYILVLRDSLEQTHCANDRPIYTKHLAAAAVMLAEYCESQDVARLQESIGTERRAYGWGYLSGTEGKAAESAFHDLAVALHAV